MAVNDLWQVIGSIATIATFLIYIFLEWSKIQEKFKENPAIKNALLRTATGSIVFSISGGLAGALALWLGGRFLLPLLNSDYKISPEQHIVLIKNYSGLIATLWAVIGAVFGFLFGVNEKPFSSTWQERGTGVFLGMIGGSFFSSVTASIFYSGLEVEYWAELVITWVIGGAVGGIIIGGLLSRFIKKLIFTLYGLKDNQT
jgi:hypothetical protein